jgi:hypothetical protein
MSESHLVHDAINILQNQEMINQKKSQSFPGTPGFGSPCNESCAHFSLPFSSVAQVLQHQFLYHRNRLDTLKKDCLDTLALAATLKDTSERQVRDSLDNDKMRK